MNLQRRVWEILQPARTGDTASRAFDISILSLIFLNVLATILGTVPSIEDKAGRFLHWFEVFSVAVFTVEYLARLWSCTVDGRYAQTVRGRIRMALSVMMIIDLAAILPFYLPFVGFDLRSLRVFRLLRILRIAKVGRYFSSLHLIKRVIISKKEELILSSAIMVLLLIVSASIVYCCENPEQPEAFSSIPATMWWAIATLTTVGYGDMYPITVLGKTFASVIAVLGIGMFALPTGILGAGFVEEIDRLKKSDETCPHCGKPIR